MTIDDQIAYYEKRLASTSSPRPEAVAILASLKRLKVLEEAVRESTCCSEHDLSGHTCGREPIRDALVEIDRSCGDEG